MSRAIDRLHNRAAERRGDQISDEDLDDMIEIFGALAAAKTIRRDLGRSYGHKNTGRFALLPLMKEVAKAANAAAETVQNFHTGNQTIVSLHFAAIGIRNTMQRVWLNATRTPGVQELWELSQTISNTVEAFGKQPTNRSLLDLITEQISLFNAMTAMQIAVLSREAAHTTASAPRSPHNPAATTGKPGFWKRLFG